MSRSTVLRAAEVVIDVLVLSVALWSAFYLRFDGDIPREMMHRLVLVWPYVIALKYGFLALMGIPRFAWRYIGLREAVRILQATALATLVLTALRLLGAGVLRNYFLQDAYLPLGVIAIDAALTFIGIAGVRALRRIEVERAEMRRLRTRDTAMVPTLVVGAGRGGVMVAKEIMGRPELGILPVGFIDDDLMKQGSVIHGLRVLGTIADVGKIARQKGVRQAIIAISNAPGSAVRNISNACQEAGLHVKIIPGLYQIVGGELNITRMRDIAIEDLLRREPVVLDDEAISGDLRGRVVVVTGAGGSIGSEICRQVCSYQPKLVVLFERSENALFEIHRELVATFPALELEPCLADVCDEARLNELFGRHRPDVVFHAAAHKHVPMLEWNPVEAIRNNVFGTQTLADAASHHRVRAFVMISTDKAVKSSSVMGATKRVAELYVQALAQQSETRFVTVRFGNVLGSAGSVVPIFKDQIARGGPVTVTHPDMTRYFMTIPEACQLVLQAGSMGRGGELFVLDMGEPVKIVDLARDLIQLSGFKRDDIEIVFTGIRPGEKLYEELSLVDESVQKTRHAKIFIGRTRVELMERVTVGLRRLAQALERRDPALVRDGLRWMIPEYAPQGVDSVPPDATDKLPAPALESRPAAVINPAT